MLQAEARRTKVKEARKRREERQDTKKKEMLQVRSDNPYVSENMKYLSDFSFFIFPKSSDYFVSSWGREILKYLPWESQGYPLRMR